MRTVILGIMLIANTALASAAGLRIEPSNATSKVIEIAGNEARNSLWSKDNRIRVTNVRVGLGKYSFGVFGDYSVKLTAVAMANGSTLSCEGKIRIVRSPVQKHEPDVMVLEISDSDGTPLETTADLRYFQCPGAGH